jgi:glycerophosphoryl diester phosphodiesterase
MLAKLRRKWSLVGIFLLVLTLALLHVPDISAFTDQAILGAHRGSSLVETENTLEAIELAVSDPQYSFIEFDVQFTKDKQLVVFHDLTLLRLQQQFAIVGDLTYEELQEVSEYPIPLYEEVMDLIGKSKPINIEVKSQWNSEENQEVVDYLMMDIAERGLLDIVMISSISDEVIAYISKNYNVPTGLVLMVAPVSYLKIEFLVESFYEDVSAVGADYVLLHGVNLNNYDLLLELKPQEATLMFWYFTDEVFLIGDEMW